MNDNISWDSSLVKKFSSSNHYKLLNHLRNEVKKYPLNKRKNSLSNISNDNIKEKNNQMNIATSQEFNSSKNSNINNEYNSNQSSVSFNNSKNFSIYNNINNDTARQQKEFELLEENKEKEDTYSSTFKERLNQIDMK